MDGGRQAHPRGKNKQATRRNRGHMLKENTYQHCTQNSQPISQQTPSDGVGRKGEEHLPGPQHLPSRS